MGGGRLLVNLVSILEQKTMRKVFFFFCFFFQAEQFAALLSFRVRNMAFSGKRVDFLKSDK